jgi:hypothetical protein
MHLHFEGIHRHLLDEKQLMTLDQLLDIQLSILLLHQIPTDKTYNKLFKQYSHLLMVHHSLYRQ